MHLDHFEDLPLLHGNRGIQVWKEVLKKHKIAVQPKIDGSVALAGGRDELGGVWVGLKSGYHNPELRYRSTPELFSLEKPRDVVWAMATLLESFYDVHTYPFRVMVDVVFTPDMRKTVDFNGKPMVYGTPNVVTYHSTDEGIATRGTHVFAVHTIDGLSYFDLYDWYNSEGSPSRPFHLIPIPMAEVSVPRDDAIEFNLGDKFNDLDFDGTQMYKLLRKTINQSPDITTSDELWGGFQDVAHEHRFSLKSNVGEKKFTDKVREFERLLFVENRNTLRAILGYRKKIQENFIIPMVLRYGLMQTYDIARVAQDIPEGVVIQHGGVLYKGIDRTKFRELNNSMGMMSNG